MSLTLSVALDPRASGADRLAAWQDVMSATGTVYVADPDALTGMLQSRELGPMRTIRIAASTFRLVRDQVRAAAMPQEHVLVNLVEAGGFDGRLAGRKLLAGPGDLVLSRLTNLMDVVLHDTDWLALVLPQKLVEQHMRWDSRLDGGVHKAGTVAAGVLGGLLRSLCALPDSLPPREIRRATRVTLATLVGCLSETSSSGQLGEAREKVTARSVARFIAKRLSDPALGVEMIRREFGVSRTGLYRIMAADTGDIAASIRTMRLHAIAQEITAVQSKAVSLAAIAAKHGMNDERSFRRAFVREFGYAPSLLREGGVPAPMPGSPGSELQRWFAGVDTMEM